MNITLGREQLLKPLSVVGSVVERRQTLPILSNVLLRVENGVLYLVGTDLEVEVTARCGSVGGQDGELTVGARKLLDICRALPEQAEVRLSREGERVVLKSGRSKFALQTLPAGDFPRIEAAEWEHDLRLLEGDAKALLERTGFAMAAQDVRYYLNGMLLDVAGPRITSVATDGHRLAKTELGLAEGGGRNIQVIVPRKGVQELGRLLGGGGDQIRVRINPNHIRFELEEFTFTSKLIDGRYPDYQKVVPAGPMSMLVLPREEFKDVLQRASILTNEKFRGVRLNIRPNTLTATAHNPEQEEASDEMSIDYNGPELEIGFNVNYLIDAVNALPGDEVQLSVKDQNSSCLLQTPGDEKTLYLVMPMRL